MIHDALQTIDAYASSSLPTAWHGWATPALVFAAVAIAMMFFGWLLTHRRRRGPAESDDASLFDRLAPALAVQIPESEKERRDFGQLLRQAGIYEPSARNTIYALRFLFLFLPFSIALGVAAVETDTTRAWQIVGVGLFASFAMSVIPRLYVYMRRRARQQRIRQALPDTIDMMSMCISGGMSVPESLDHLALQIRFTHRELAQELAILRKQADVGSLKMALQDFSDRVGMVEARQLANLLSRSTRLGTELAGSLNEQADHLRVARRQHATAAANKTPVKLVLPTLFCFAPAALILLTAPALLELKEFLAPSGTGTTTEATATTDPAEGFGTGAVIDALQKLNQKNDLVSLAE